MNQHRRRTARAIAIARTDESRTRKMLGLTYSAAALTAVVTVIAISAFWSF